ncbi:Uncharacterized protein TPAR_02180 [Tolypocladium paradoxum]|uniref:ADF-H domain-containing protein n=1 Tax=Tolypocladium paradoxum TaxID=94208 RepID=A0A2S4L5B0_9HYPO|nr:Uncharacterized protein TPAR_02180 [Tolypocladium paradoxum]
MSLNGLDDPKIVEAHETSTSEPGGWLLLKYSSRDEVELLSRGNGGIVEVRNAVTEYDETSPLYGFLKYRRRNVIIKYLPEDCSRLIQVRVAVHFNAICERFSPYDTTFEIAAASELKDTKLSAACSLHAASCSTSSSTSSLRRRRLMEIAEEEEEEQRATKRQSVQEPDGERPTSPVVDTSAVEPVTLNSQLAASPEHSKFSAGSTSELPTFVGVDDRPTSPAKSIGADSIRPELFSYSSYPYSKPKVKLGPRPSLDVNGRPQTAGNFRPVSAIPAGFKLFGKGSKKTGGSRDRHAAASPQEDIASLNFASSTIAIPEEALRVQGDAARPVTSSGVPAESGMMPPPPTSKKQIISPEKARLMKAMRLREKKKKMSMQPPATVPSSNDVATPESKKSQTDLEDNAQEGEHLPRPEQDVENDLMKADSSVVVHTLSSSVHCDRTSDATQSDSRPTSPIVASSEAEQSTKASSLSESTDETVRAKDEELLPDQEDVEPVAPSEGSLANNTQPDGEDVLVADESKLEGTALPTSEDTKEPSVAESLPDGAAPAAQIVREDAVAPEPDHTVAEEHASDATTASELSRPPAAPLDTSTNTRNDSHEPREIVALPISKFSANIPSSPKSPQEALMGNVDPETTGIPAAESTKPATATDINEEPSSQQPKTLKTKVSTQDLLAAAKAATQQTAASPLPQSVLEESPASASDEPTVDERNQEHDDSETETIPAQADKPRRRGFIEPIRTDLAQHSRQTSRSEANFSDDEELMEELRSATVQEAKPMLVAKTPVSATFPSSPIKGPGLSGAPKAHMVRTISNPVRSNLAVPMDVSQASARSMSSGAAYLHQVAQQQQQQGGNLAKKSNIGSSISQRIRALEKLSAASGEPGAPAARERPSSTFFAVKKREPSRSPSVMDRANSLRKTPESPSRSNESSPDAGKRTRRDRSGSVTSRLSVFESPPGANSSGRSPGNTKRGRPESVSVTAKIIRDPNHSMKFGFDPPKDPSEYSHLELKQSPLLVDHQKAMPEPTQETVEPASERRSGSQERGKSGKSRQSSLSIVKDFIMERRKSVTSNQGDVLAAANPSRSPSRPVSVHQNSAFSPRLSISSCRSSISKDRESVVSPTGESLVDDAKSTNGDKKLSRAGRFMRRLSTLSGSRGKNSPTGISSTVTEEEIPEPAATRPATTGTPTIVSYMGDVNVQFPDNLLWKRRNMCLDSQGFLILSALSAQSGRQAQGTKRYHLAEFRAPYMPDVEVQELPNSVVLDFIEGTSIQVACEDRAGQLNVLSVLQEAHANRGSTYGL